MIERLLAAQDALDRGDPEAAGKLFAKVVEADPKNAIAHVGLARIAGRRGDIDAARAAVARALSIDPDEAAARRLLAELDAPRIGPRPAQQLGQPTQPPVPQRGQQPRLQPKPARDDARRTPGRRRASSRGTSLLDRLGRWLRGSHRRR